VHPQDRRLQVHQAQPQAQQQWKPMKKAQR
jgi:hypothetical protein